MALIPIFSSIIPALVEIILLESHPVLILTVTGTSGTFSTTEEATSSICDKFFNAAAPAPFFVTLGTGQPKFISIISG